MTQHRGLKVHGERPGPRLRTGLFLLVLVGAGAATLLVGTDGGESGAEATAEIVLGGRGTEEHVVPTRAIVRTGGTVVFRTVDHRLHSVEFDLDRMAPEASSFLEASGQDRSPPLIERGTEYTVSFEGAPPGFYPFHVRGPGSPVEGAIVVE